MPNRLLITMSLLAVGLLGLAGLMLYKGTSPSEVAALLSAEVNGDGGRYEHALAPNGAPGILPSTTYAAWAAVPTVLEQTDVRSYVTPLTRYRGVDLLVRPDSGTFADLASFFAGPVYFSNQPGAKEP